MEDITAFIQEQFVLVAALAILVGMLVRRESVSAGAKLSLNEVVQAMNAETAVLIDVRDKKEFETGHVANAINIPHTKVNDSLSLLEPHKGKQIIVTDNMGQHAGSVTQQLKKNNYNVARMRGGMSEWKQEGLPLVR